MSSKHMKGIVAKCAVVLAAGVASTAACIPGLSLPGIFDPNASAWVLRWNEIAIDASGLDHTPVKDGESRTFGHQLGPTRSSRAMAIVHIAMFDAILAIHGGYEPYTDIADAPANTSTRVAIAQAVHDTLVALYPSHSPYLGVALREDLDAETDATARANGIAVGHAAAAAILALRENDGSDIADPYTFKDAPGKWRVDPINPTQTPHGANWNRVQPFVLNRADQFRCPPPPSIDSNEYAVAFEEAKTLGGDGINTATTRTSEQTHVGIFWAYDGTPSLCAPPRLYNQVARTVAETRPMNFMELARLLALLNVSMADTGIAAWESKFYYEYWRPVCAIRESDPGTGPSGLGDGNANTTGDANFVPLCAPASNLAGPNFTPPFPAYPSGHAAFGGALFESLREFYGTDNMPFTFVSDEFNGVTVDNEGNARPFLPRHFSTLSQAEEENGQSRIYLGIHWSFDKSEGIVQGNRVAEYVFGSVYQPVP